MGAQLEVVELFAGVGGFRCGLDEAHPESFKTVWANQWEPGTRNQFAFDCYASHFSGSMRNEDISTVIGEVPDHDLLVGGFPCQDYSVAATKARGIEGKKGVLWWSIREIIQNHHPRYVLLENVDRLVRSPVNQRGRDFGIILRCLEDEGYYVEWRIINAADYGQQQKRRRTFIFACRKDSEFVEAMAGEEPFEIITRSGFFAGAFPVRRVVIASRARSIRIGEGAYPSLVDVSNDFEATFYNAGFMVDGNVFTMEVQPEFDGKRTTLGDILQKDVDERYYVPEEQLVRWREAKGAKHIVRRHRDGTPYVYSEGAIPFPDNLDTPGRTMLTSEGTVSRSSHLILDPETNRYRVLTPVECERLNGFPDNWTNTGMSDRQRYFTMGNALVVPLVQRMGQRILEIHSSV